MGDPTPFLQAAKRYGSEPAFDRWARTKYGVSGPALLAKVAKGEGNNDMNAVSSAGARGGTQFMPATRQAFIDRYGVDAWKNPDSAIHATKLYLQHDPRGLAGYNPGMPTYSKYILDQNVGDLGASSAAPRTPAGTPATTTRTVGAVDNSAQRGALIASFLGTKGADPLQFAMGIRGLQDIPGQQVTTSARQNLAAAAVTPAAGQGGFQVTGANPGRIKPAVLQFARQVSAIYGKPLTGDSGATHSKMTVDGNVSDHYTGNATDIPASGGELIRLGRAALVAAGMPRAQASKAPGGLYNVGGHQVIFATMSGGNHFDHLHISAR